MYLSLYTCPLHFHSGPSKVRFESPRTPEVRAPSPQVAESEEKDASPERIPSSITPWSEHSQSLSVSDKQSLSGSPTPGTRGMHIANESFHQCYVKLTKYLSFLYFKFLSAFDLTQRKCPQTRHLVLVVEVHPLKDPPRWLKSFRVPLQNRQMKTVKLLRENPPHLLLRGENQLQVFYVYVLILFDREQITMLLLVCLEIL